MTWRIAQQQHVIVIFNYVNILSDIEVHANENPSGLP
jgi:hypothetical protein